MSTPTEKRLSESILPTPDARPGTDVVIYDGDCVICTGGVKILYYADWFHRLSYVSLHDPRVSQIAPELSFDQMMKEMWVVDPLGRKYSGAGAFRYLTRRLVLLWPVMPLLHIPGSLPLWQWLYGKVAAARYRFGRRGGEDCGDACALHFGAPKEKEATK